MVLCHRWEEAQDIFIEVVVDDEEREAFEGEVRESMVKQRWKEWTLYFLQPRTSRRHVKISILRVVLKDADLIAILCMQS